MKKYQTNKSICGKLIRVVECDHETKSTVWINGQRNAVNTICHCYFDTFEEAKAYLLKVAESKVQSARASLDRANADLVKVKGLKESNN